MPQYINKQIPSNETVPKNGKECNTRPQLSKVNIVSLFAGAGGLDIAACNTGRVAAITSTDSNPIFLSTLEKNLPRHFPEVRHSIIATDVLELHAETIRKTLGHGVDIVMGGPPCDDYTQFGKRRGFSGEKGPLIFEFLRLVDELKPACYVFENVPNLARQFKDVFGRFLKKSQEIGYFSKWALLKACDYGAPTLRTRVLVIGWRNKSENEDFYFPLPTHGDQTESVLLLEPTIALKPFVYVRDAFSGLPDVNTQEGVRFLNHTGRPHRPETIEHLKTVPQGKNIKKSFRYRAPWVGLSQSLTAGVDYATKSYIHPHYHREMSVREYARIHGFPDTWEFSGNHHHGVKQVANSVPIPLGEAILAAVLQHLVPRLAETNAESLSLNLDYT